MWVAKLKGFDKNNIYGSKAIKHKIIIYYYPINYYVEKRIYYFIAVGILEGKNESIKSFFRDLKKDKKISKDKRYVVSLETKGNFFICITAQSQNLELRKYVRLFYNPKFIHINPAIIDSNGFEEWNIASLRHEDLREIINISEKMYSGKLLLLKKSKIGDIGVLSILPNLTEKQKTAFLLAVNNGYYEYPRGIELIKLAKLMNLSLSTYQAHLRKAERQLFPFIAKKYF